MPYDISRFALTNSGSDYYDVFLKPGDYWLVDVDTDHRVNETATMRPPPLPPSLLRPSPNDNGDDTIVESMVVVSSSLSVGDGQSTDGSGGGGRVVAVTFTR